MRSLLFLASLCGLWPIPASGDETLRVAAVPWLAEPEMRRLYGPTLRLLERKLSTPVELQIALDYDELTSRVTSKVADIAIYGPAGYVRAKKQFPAIRYLVSCRLPEDHYFSLVVTRKDAAIRALTDARGRSVGFTDKQSTSGYVVPRILFAEAGLNIDRDARVFLLGQHFRVLEAVAARTVDMGAVDSGAWDSAIKQHGEIFHVVAKSAPIPRDPVAAAPHLDAKLAARIQKILAEAHLDTEFAREPSQLKGYTIRSDKFYDPIREISP